MKADLLIKDGTIVTSQGSYCADVIITDEKIQAILQNVDDIDVKTTIDARGKMVLPGIWHAHCHFRDPGMTHKEDFTSGSQCAAAGGITFVIDQTNNDPPPTTVETFLAKKEMAESKSVVDFGLYGGGLDPKEVDGLAKNGAIGIKVFNTRHVKDKYPYMSSLAVIDHGLLYEIYEKTADTGLVCAVHHDDPDWTRRLVYRDFIDKNRIDSRAYVEAYKNGYMYGHAMVSGLASSLYLAKLSKVRLYVLHTGIMPPEHYNLISYARKNGQTVYSELEASAILISEEMAIKVGPKMAQYALHPEKAWKHINSGEADVLVFEHAPHAKNEIEKGKKDMFSSPLGMVGAQEFLPMMLNEVNKGNLSLEKLIWLSSESPARIFGIYPRKGTLQVGSDADITIVDMNAEMTLTADNSYSKAGWTTFEGIRVKGVPTHTIVRGSIVCENGKVKAKPGFGRFVQGQAFSR